MTDTISIDNINMSEIKQQSDFNSINEYGIYLKELYFSNIKDINGSNICEIKRPNIKISSANTKIIIYDNCKVDKRILLLIVAYKTVLDS